MSYCLSCSELNHRPAEFVVPAQAGTQGPLPRALGPRFSRGRRDYRRTGADDDICTGPISHLRGFCFHNMTPPLCCGGNILAHGRSSNVAPKNEKCIPGLSRGGFHGTAASTSTFGTEGGGSIFHRGGDGYRAGATGGGYGSNS